MFFYSSEEQFLRVAAVPSPASRAPCRRMRITQRPPHRQVYAAKSSKHRSIISAAGYAIVHRYLVFAGELNHPTHILQRNYIRIVDRAHHKSLAEFGVSEAL